LCSEYFISKEKSQMVFGYFPLQTDTGRHTDTDGQRDRHADAKETDIQTHIKIDRQTDG
jgi:hypothetical protein